MWITTGDADMIPGVEEAVDAGVRVHLYGFGWDSMSSNLRFACDSTTILDPREDFRDCMRLQILEGPLPPTVPCPAGENPPEDTPTAPESQAQYKPLGDARPVEDLSGTSVVPDLRRRKRHPAVPSPVEDIPAPSSGAASTGIPGMPQAVASGVEITVTGETTGAEPEAPQGTETVAGAPEESAGAGQDSTPTPVPLTPGGAPESADDTPSARPNPSMMAPRRRMRSRYVPLPTEIWQSSGEQSPFDVGQQYAVWWYEHAATSGQREDVHTLSGGGLPPAINQPLVQFACQTLHEVTLSENQRIHLRDGFHSGIRGILRTSRGR